MTSDNADEITIHNACTYSDTINSGYCQNWSKFVHFDLRKGPFCDVSKGTIVTEKWLNLEKFSNMSDSRVVLVLNSTFETTVSLPMQPVSI